MGLKLPVYAGLLCMLSFEFMRKVKIDENRKEKLNLGLLCLRSHILDCLPGIEDSTKFN